MAGSSDMGNTRQLAEQASHAIMKLISELPAAEREEKDWDPRIRAAIAKIIAEIYDNHVLY